jgi:hypothetical protein
MAWFKVDDGFYSSLKFLSISRDVQVAAAGAWVLAGTWSADKMTDGFVPYQVMDLWVFPTEAVSELVRVGLWVHDEDRDGIVFHDWHDYQPSREQLEEKSKARHERSVKAAQARWSKSDAKTMLTDANGMLNDAPEPEPEPEPTPKGVVRATRLPKDFAVTQDMVEWAAEKHPNVDIVTQTDAFRDYWVGLSGSRATKTDWVATWRNWIRNSKPAPGVRVTAFDRNMETVRMFEQRELTS